MAEKLRLVRGLHFLTLQDDRPVKLQGTLGSASADIVDGVAL